MAETGDLERGYDNAKCRMQDANIAKSGPVCNLHFASCIALEGYSVAGTRKAWTGLVSDPIFSIAQTLVSPAFR